VPTGLVSRCATACRQRATSRPSCAARGADSDLAARAEPGATKELADGLRGGVAEDGGLLAERDRSLRAAHRLRAERVELEARLRALKASGMEPFVSTTCHRAQPIASSCRSSSTTPSGWRESCRDRSVSARRRRQPSGGRASTTAADAQREVEPRSGDPDASDAMIRG